MEKLISRARGESEEAIYAELCERLTVDEQRSVLKLMEVNEERKTSRFQEFQQAAGNPSPQALERELELLNVIHQVLPASVDLRDLHPQLLERLAKTEAECRRKR